MATETMTVAEFVKSYTKRSGCNCILARADRYTIELRRDEDGTLRHDPECCANLPQEIMLDALETIAYSDCESGAIARNALVKAERAEFSQALRRAGDIVKTWPRWKRGILGKTM